MTLLLYYISHTLVNSIKKLFKSWVAIFVVAMLVFALVGGLVGALIGGAADDAAADNPAYEQQISEFEPDEQTVETILEIAVSGIALLVLFFNAYTSDKSGSAIFTMPDVNILFQAPLKPQSVLLFRVILQMGVALIGSLYLVFQLPNLILNVGLPVRTCVAIIIAWFFMLAFAKLLAIWIYTLCATHTRLRKYIRPAAIAILAVPVLFVGAVKIFVTNNWFTALQLVFCSAGSKHLPCVGWMTGFVSSINGSDYTSGTVYALGLILLCVVFIVLIWRMRADFYEDALDGAAKRTEQLEAAKSGSKITATPKKHRHTADEDALPPSEIGSGSGAGIFFTKALYVRRRNTKFGFSGTGVTYLLICAAAVALSFVIPINSVSIPAAVISVILFFANFGNPISEDTSCLYLVSVPESPYKKVFACLCGSTVKAALDLIPAFLISAIAFSGSLANTAMWYLLLVSLDFFCSATGLLTELALPAQLQRAIKSAIQIWLNMLAVVPGIILLSMGAIMDFLPMALLITALAQLAAAALFATISGRLLHKD